jgi:hypothetical protein
VLRNSKGRRVKGILKNLVAQRLTILAIITLAPNLRARRNLPIEEMCTNIKKAGAKNSKTKDPKKKKLE